MYPSPCKLCSVRGRGLPQTNQYNWTHNSKQILIENTRNTHTYIHSELILNGYHMFAGECLMIQHNLIVLCNVIYALAIPLTHCLVVFYLATICVYRAPVNMENITVHGTATNAPIWVENRIPIRAENYTLKAFHKDTKAIYAIVCSMTCH